MKKSMSFDGYIKYMKKGIVHTLLKIEFLRFEDESTYSSFIYLPLSGNITVNAVSGGIRRSCSIVLPNFDKSFIPNSNDNSKPWLNTKFMVYMGVVDDFTGETMFFPQGEYTLSNSDLEVISDYSSKTVSLKADDKFSLLDNPIGSIYQINIGESVTNAIRSILQICGDKKEPIIEDLPDILPSTLRWSQTDTYGKILSDLSKLYSRECFYNSTGHLVFQSFKDVSILNNAWEFTDKEIQYEGSNRIYKFSEIINDITIVGGTIDSLTFQSHVQNNDLTSNSRISLIGLKSLVIQDEKIYSSDLCLQRANYELERRKRMQELITIKSSPLFHLDVNQAVTVVDDSINLYRDRYSIQSFTLDLTAKTQMTIQAYKFNDTTEYEDLGLPS